MLTASFINFHFGYIDFLVGKNLFAILLYDIQDGNNFLGGGGNKNCFLKMG